MDFIGSIFILAGGYVVGVLTSAWAKPRLKALWEKIPWRG